VENVEKDQCVGSIFGNQFPFLLLSSSNSNDATNIAYITSVENMELVDGGQL